MVCNNQDVGQLLLRNFQEPREIQYKRTNYLKAFQKTVIYCLSNECRSELFLIVPLYVSKTWKENAYILNCVTLLIL